jgi:translation initiation factor IF-2
VLVQAGTLKTGDIVVAGDEWGRVRAIINDRGEQLKEAEPSLPVEILGLNGTPQAGDGSPLSTTRPAPARFPNIASAFPARRRSPARPVRAVRSNR